LGQIDYGLSPPRQPYGRARAGRFIVISQSDLECEKQTVLTTRPAQVICSSGGLSTGLSSLFFGFSEKYLLPPDPNQI
jgi:hypothetical protein